MAPLRAQYIAQRTPFSRTSQTENNVIILPEPEMLYARFLPCLNHGSLIFRGGQITTGMTRNIKLWQRRPAAAGGGGGGGGRERGRLVNAEFSHNEAKEWPGTKKRREKEEGLRGREGERATSCEARAGAGAAARWIHTQVPAKAANNNRRREGRRERWGGRERVESWQIHDLQWLAQQAG